MKAETWTEWAWLWREMRPQVGWQMVNLVCIISSTAVGLSQPLLMKWLIDEILPRRRWDELAVVTVLVLLSTVGRSLLASLGSLVNALMVTRMTFRTRGRLVRHVLSLSADFHTKRSVGDLIQRLERDVYLVGNMGADLLPSIVRVVVEMSMSVGLMLYLDWRMAVVLVPLTVFFGYVRYHYRRTLRKRAEEVREASGRQSSVLQEMLTGAIQIQLLNSTRILRNYTRLGLRTMQRETGQRREEVKFALASMSVVGLGTALIVGYGGARVLTGGLTLGGLVAFYGYIGNMFSPVTVAVRLYAEIIRVQASIRRLIDIEQAPEAIVEAPDAVPLPRSPSTIVCNDLGFRYGAEVQTLHHVHFSARKGERIAIIGESGSGKSSLLKLLLRLYDSSEGSVTFDGRDIRSLQLASLRSNISFVPQDPVLFQGTLRENLRYGSATTTAEEFERAAWIACLTEVVDQLPRRWDTELGPMGTGLSGGEKQRVMIMRALLQRRPVLILDESMSALDAATETQLLSRLRPWAADRIVIVVSHRSTAADWADRVVRIRRGRIEDDEFAAARCGENAQYDILSQTS